MFELSEPSPIQEIKSPLFSDKEVQIWLKREDQIDPAISGNKWRKLKYNFTEAHNQGFTKLLTFGGAYSNHIAATAAAAYKYGFQSIGIIRGDELHANSNATLRQAHAHGMELQFVSRDSYKHRNETKWIEELQHMHSAFVVPEGGSNSLALLGVAEMVKEINQPFDFIICPVGTGGTLAGITQAINPNQHAIGVAVLNAAAHLEESVSQLLGTPMPENCQIAHDYHCGGYAKFNDSLIRFIEDFYQESHIQLDPIYTGKMMFGLYDLIRKDHFPKDSKIIAIHTGGLQGISDFNAKHNIGQNNE